MQRTLLRGGGTSILNEVKRIEKGKNTKQKKQTKKQEHTWTRTHDLFVVNSLP